MTRASYVLFTIFCIAAATAQLGGCQQDGVSAQPAAAALVQLSPAVLSQADQLLASYENVRARLAKDDVTGLNADLQTLEAAANQAVTLATASAPAQSKFKTIATAAKALRDMNKSNADDVRKSFGELSRHVVLLIASVPKLQQGRFVFQCPMAQGYQKWVQTSTPIQNPYMGTHMLTCGSPSDWS